MCGFSRGLRPSSSAARPHAQQLGSEAMLDVVAEDLAEAFMA
jgi:hypothetical protein